MKQTRKLLLLVVSISFLLGFSETKAQSLVQVLDETITVNSIYALSGNTRNKAEIRLPEKTKSYIYRISVFKKGEGGINKSLLEILNDFGGAKVSLMTSFANFAVKNNDNLAVDAFIFNNIYDAENFIGRKDGNWSACKSMPNRQNSCFVMSQCLNRDVFFGFRNNNISQGLDVKLEVVALVDSTQKADHLFSFKIVNSSGREIKYLISKDEQNWEQDNLRHSYFKSYSIEQRYMYFKIYTDKQKFVYYKINPEDRYKIIWNTNKAMFDLIRY